MVKRVSKVVRSGGGFTPEALAAFRAYEAGELDVFALQDACDLKPWERFVDPRWTCPFPEDSWAAGDWHDRRTPEAFELYYRLKAATS